MGWVRVYDVDVTDGAGLGDAVRARLNDLGQTQTWLGERMGELHGRRPYGQSTVGTWMARTEPTPELVFDLERALDLPPGHLSKLLGYVPVSVVAVACSVPVAIEADPMLDERGRRSRWRAWWRRGGRGGGRGVC